MIKSISYLTVLSSILLLSGCFSPVSYESCINGVVYYEKSSSLAPAYNRDGSLILCEEENQNESN